MRILEELVVTGRDLAQFTADFTWYLRNLLLARASEEFDEILEVSSDQLALIRQEAALCDAELLMRYIRIFSELSGQVKYTSQKRVLIEITLIKLCRPEMETDYSSLVSRLKRLEKRIEEGIPIAENGAGSAAIQETSPEGPKEPEVLPEALSEDLRAAAQNWKAVIAGVSPSVRSCLANARPSPGNGSTLLLVFESKIDKEWIESGDHFREIEDAAAKVIGRRLTIETKLAGENQMGMEDYPDLTKVFKNVPIEYTE